MRKKRQDRQNRISGKLCAAAGVAFLALGALTAAVCGGAATEEGGTEIERAGEEKAVTLVLAAFGQNPELMEQVAVYNRNHTEYQIEVERYERSDILEEDGIARLQREIVTGKGPDLIDFGAGYAVSDIVSGYTEDLWPYLEKEREENGLDCFDNILEGFCCNGKLYALPIGFTLQTFVGSRTVLGDRDSWSIRELVECYENRKPGTILYPGEMKKDVFGTLVHGNLDHYIDWGTGSCSFDSEEFAQILTFADQFPDMLRITEEYSAKQIFHEGGALLYPMRMSRLYDICSAEYIFDAEDITYIGFPVEDGCGTVISPSALMPAISANSAHKEAAWRFIAQFLDLEYQTECVQGYPICRAALLKRLEANREIAYEADAEGNLLPVARDQIRFEGEEPMRFTILPRSRPTSSCA